MIGKSAFNAEFFAVANTLVLSRTFVKKAFVDEHIVLEDLRALNSIANKSLSLK